MENQFQPIDNHFRNQASGMKSPLTAEEKAGIWSGIANAKRRKFVPVWWIVGALAGLILFTGFYIYQNVEKSDNEEQFEALMDVPMALQQSAVNLQEVIQQDFSNGINKVSESELTTFTAPIEKIGDTETFSMDFQTERKEQVLAISNPSALGSFELSDELKILDDSFYPAKENLIKDGSISASEIGTFILSLERKGTNEAVNILQTALKQLPMSTHPKDLTLLTYSIKNKTSSANHYSSRWSIEAYSSVLKPTASIKAKTPAAADLASQWSASFDPQWLYSVGVMANYHLNERWSIAAGAEASRLTSYSTNVQQNRSFKIGWSDQAYYYLDEEGQKVWVGDSVLTSVQATAGIKKANAHDKIVIPFHLNYQLPLNSWSIRAGIGVALSVFQKHKAHIYDESSLFVKTEDEFGSSMTLDGRLNIGTAYAINQDWELFLQGSLQMGLSNRLNDDFPISMDLNFSGLSLGARKYL